MMRRAGRFDTFGRSIYDWRRRSGVRQWENWRSSIMVMAGKRWVPIVILLMGLVSVFHRIMEQPPVLTSQNVEHNLWSTAPSFGWQASSAQRSNWLPPQQSNGYLVAYCDGGLNQQRIAICNAVLAARIMNATLVLPHLDTNSFWQDKSGFPDIYDADHFITTLKSDVRVVRSLPTIWVKEKKKIKLKPYEVQDTSATKRLLRLSGFSICELQCVKHVKYERLAGNVKKHQQGRFQNEVAISVCNGMVLYLCPKQFLQPSHVWHSLMHELHTTLLSSRDIWDSFSWTCLQLRPPHDASVTWYETTALEKLKDHGAVYLTPFSHHLAEKVDNPEYQRLRCRVNYHALRFTSDIRNLSSLIVERLRLEGPYVAIHLPFEMDMLAFAGCLDTFNSREQEVLKKYRKENFAEKELVQSHGHVIGKCPLTPKEVGLFLRALGFDNSTRIYLAAGEIFGGQTILDPLQALFPRLGTRLTVAMPEELALVKAEGHGLFGAAVDYLVCLLSEIFIPTYDGPSNFANNLIGQRLYYGFRTTIQPDQKALAPLVIALESGVLKHADFEVSVRKKVSQSPSGSPRARVPLESFYTNPWPECFCTNSPNIETKYICPSKTISNLSYDEDENDNLAEWSI